MENLLAKYRPLHLADVRGQPDVVRALALFAQDPYPTAFLLHGESGIGKTSTATALANELGCVIDDNELGGFSEIASGEQTKDSVKDKLNYLRYRPLMGSGWRVLVVNEADQMSIAAEGVWLDALEHLTNQTVIIFTTNAPGKLSRRLRDRCEVFGFEWESAKLQPAIQDLARTVWLKEVGHGEPPGLDTLGMPTLGNLDEMHASFRLALQQLTRLVREAKAGGDLDGIHKRMRKDQVFAKKAVKAKCPFCNKTSAIIPGADEYVCPKCAEKFSVAY